MKLSNIKLNPNNPRTCDSERFDKLVKSIKEFPKMLKLRPLIINGDNIVLGGNMRLKALKEIGYKEVPDEWVRQASELTEDEQRRFIIADNVGFGEHDWEMLSNDWDSEELSGWGLDIPDYSEKDDNIDSEYTKKVKAPIYEAKNEKPLSNDLYNIERTKQLIEEIDSSNCNPEDKQFLKLAAQRHCVFNYELIADYYAHSEKNVQKLMEDSALIIIDFNKAIKLGYVKLTEEIAEQYSQDYDKE